MRVIRFSCSFASERAGSFCKQYKKGFLEFFDKKVPFAMHLN